MTEKMISLMDKLIKNHISYTVMNQYGTLYIRVYGKADKNGYTPYIRISDEIGDLGWYIRRDGICEKDVPEDVVVEYCVELEES